MIELKDISHSFGSRQLFDNLSWQIRDNKRIALFGPNGTGKTTLLDIISGQFEPDRGQVIIPKTEVVGYLPQETDIPDSDHSVLGEAMTVFHEVTALEQELVEITHTLRDHSDNSADHTKLLQRLDEIEAELKVRDSHRLRSKAEKLLMGLGFSTVDIASPLRTFSGGWRMRVALAKLLLLEPDVLLLDEPTNHLDIESISWLEDYLKGFGGTVVLVSHDQYFLDRMIDTVAELRSGIVTEYSGNLSAYTKEKRSRFILQKSAYDNQQRKIKETERFIERFRYKNTKAKQVQSRVKMLEKLERIPLPESDDATIKFAFPEPKQPGKVVYEISQFSKVYQSDSGESNEVFKDSAPLIISRGDKIALIGKNGTGKSTLSRMIIGAEPFLGSAKLGHNVDITYFAQHQAQTLTPTNTIIEEIRAEGVVGNETEIRTLLGTFLFTEDDVYKRIEVLSGGEKSRVALAKTLLAPKNFMVLDEPTNHLDIQSRMVLIEALRHYKGTFVVVSHDRYFLDRVANKVWYLDGAKVHVYPGTYSEYHDHITRKDSSTERFETEISALNPKDSELETGTPILDKKATAEQRNRLHRELTESGLENMDDWKLLSVKQLTKALLDLETKIHTTESTISELDKMIHEPSFYDNPDRAKNTTNEYRDLNDSLSTMYKRWEEVSAHLSQNSQD